MFWRKVNFQALGQAKCFFCQKLYAQSFFGLLGKALHNANHSAVL